MPTFEAISTNEAMIPPAPKQSGDERTTDAGFLAMLAQMLFGTTEQPASVNRVNQVPDAEALSPSFSIERLGAERNINTLEVLEHTAFNDEISSFEILPKSIPSNAMHRKQDSEGKPLQAVYRVEYTASPSEIEAVDLLHESQSLQRNASRAPIPESELFEDVDSWFEIISKIPAQPSQTRSRVDEASATIHEQTAIRQEGSRSAMNDRALGRTASSPSHGKQLTNLPSFIVDDLIHWEEIETRVRQKPEQLEAYMKVASELRAVANRFSLGLSKAPMTVDPVPVSARRMEFEQHTTHADSMSDVAVIEELSRADAATLRKHGSANNVHQFSETDAMAVGAGELLAVNGTAAATPTVPLSDDEQIVVAQPFASEPKKAEEAKTISAFSEKQPVHEHGANATSRHQDLIPQPTHAQNASAGSYSSHQPMLANAELPQPNAAVLESQAMIAMPALPEDFGTKLILKATEGLRLHLEGKSEGVRVVLKPETLGELTIRARMEEGKVFAEIRVQQTEVKAALEAQVPQLRDILVSQGIDVQRVEIVSDGGEMHFYNSDEGRASHQRPARFRRGQKNVDAVEELDAVRSLGYNTIEYII
jgi:hypothetical protein